MLARRGRSRVFAGTDLLVLPLVLVLAALPLFFFGRNWRVPPDGAWYLLQGWNLISGQGYTVLGVPQTVRGPVFPGVLGLLMFPLGRDTENLAWAARLLALANPVLVYFLLKRVSTATTGLLAAALVTLFGYTALNDQAFNIDAALTTTFLLAVLALLAAVRTGGIALSLLSGLLLGSAILTKETAFAVLPLAPFAALLLGWRVRGVLLHYAGLALVCLPWWVWVWSSTGEVYLVGRVSFDPVIPIAAVILAVLLAAGACISGGAARLLASERRRRWLAWTGLIAWLLPLSALLMASGTEAGSLRATLKYLQVVLVGTTPFWYLLPFAVAYVVWRAALRGDKLFELYLALLALQVPISLLVLLKRFDSRQWMVPQTLLYGALAALVVAFLLAAMRRGVPHRWMKATAATVLLVAVLVAAPSQLEALARTDNDRDVSVSDHYNSSVREMYEWIDQNVPGREKIITLWHYSDQLIFLDNGQHEWALLEMDCRELGPEGQHVSNCVPGKEIAQEPPEEAVWFEMDNECNAVAMAMPSLLRQLEEAEAEYVLVTQEPSFPSTLSWAPYLQQTGAFQIVHEEYLPYDASFHGEPADRAGTPYPAGLVLLQRTDRNPELAPTRVSSQTFRWMLNCGKRGELPWLPPGIDREARDEAFRATFPNGIELVDDQEGAERIKKLVDRIYGPSNTARTG